MASAAPRTMIGLLKQACNEIPEVVGATALGTIGFVLAGFVARTAYVNNWDNRRYKLNYIIVRPDDPRVARIRKD